MLSTFKLSHVRYLAAVIQAVEIANQQYKNAGLTNNLDIESVSISKAAVTLKHDTPEELFNLGFSTNALLSNTLF